MHAYTCALLLSRNRLTSVLFANSRLWSSSDKLGYSLSRSLRSFLPSLPDKGRVCRTAMFFLNILQQTKANLSCACCCHSEVRLHYNMSLCAVALLIRPEVGGAALRAAWRYGSRAAQLCTAIQRWLHSVCECVF